MLTSNVACKRRRVIVCAEHDMCVWSHIPALNVVLVDHWLDEIFRTIRVHKRAHKVTVARGKKCGGIRGIVVLAIKTLFPPISHFYRPIGVFYPLKVILSQVTRRTCDVEIELLPKGIDLKMSILNMHWMIFHVNYGRTKVYRGVQAPWVDGVRRLERLDVFKVPKVALLCPGRKCMGALDVEREKNGESKAC